MIEYATIARPYAKAVFELANEKSQFDLWLDGLHQSAWLIQQPQVVDLINSVQLSDSDKAKQFLALLDGSCEAVKNAEFEKFIAVVSEEKRLVVLPEIYKQFKQQVLLEKGAQQAIVYTAYDVVSKIVADLEQYFHVSLQATFVTDSKLIGGIKVVVGDKVLDLSIQAKLQQLYATMTN